MGSCLSTSKFQGEGRTLNDAAPPTAAPTSAAGAGQRLGGSPNPAGASASAGGGGGSTSAAEREARVRAAEQRMSQQASKGNPNQGKLSQKLNSQKQTNPLKDARDEPPERVVWD